MKKTVLFLFLVLAGMQVSGETPAEQAARSRPVAVRHSFADRFDQASSPCDFPFWMPVSGAWRVQRNGKTAVMTLAAPIPEAQLLLHVFGQDVTFSGRFRITRTPENGRGGLYFLGRTSDYPDWSVRAGYDYGGGMYRVREQFWGVREYDGAKTAPEPGVWHRFELRFQGGRLALSVDGETVVSTDKLVNLNYGRVGFLLENTAVEFADIALVSENIPMDGVREFLMGVKSCGYAGSLNVLRLNDGKLLAHFTGQEGVQCRESVDDGASWHVVSDSFNGAWGQVGVERLPDGRLLAVRISGQGNVPPRDLIGRISGDDGKSWSEEFNISDGGVNMAMNGKITPVSGGRIFIPVTKGNGTEGEKGGGIRIFYSDDARHWQKTPHDLDQKTTGENLQEGQIVELSDGRLMLVMRGDKPFLWKSESKDRGMTWSNPEPMPIPSVMCAFGIRRAPDTGELYLFWTFDDISQHPVPQFPRERVSLAVSRDDGKTWQFLGDIAACGGWPGRYMNLGLFVEGKYLFLTTTVFRFDSAKSIAVKLWRVEREKLRPYPEFPPVH